MAEAHKPNLIFSINAGSSSVKISVFKPPQPDSESWPEPIPLAKASIDSITAPPASMKYQLGETIKFKGRELPKDKVNDQASAFAHILEHLMGDSEFSELSQESDISHITHRIVHGGNFSHMEPLNPQTYHKLEELSDLAPLHNIVGLQIVRTAHEKLPHAENWAYFDSAFHASMPNEIKTYPIDQDRAKKNGLRKYGFHGISYAFITRSVGQYLNKEEPNIIALHLGSGASACAIKDGQSLDTSMGLTPAAGLPGGSRAGDVDPSMIFHFTHEAGNPSHSSTKEMHITNAEEILNKKSGFKALTGSADFGFISSKAQEGNAECKLAFDLFVDRVLNYIGSYYVKLEGNVDALVLAGGIGEKGAAFRERIVERCRCLGFAIDSAANEKPADEIVAEIGGKSSKHRVLVCQTDEQYEMARGCVIEASKRAP